MQSTSHSYCGQDRIWFLKIRERTLDVLCYLSIYLSHSHLWICPLLLEPYFRLFTIGSDKINTRLRLRILRIRGNTQKMTDYPSFSPVHIWVYLNWSISILKDHLYHMLSIYLSIYLSTYWSIWARICMKCVWLKIPRL